MLVECIIRNGRFTAPFDGIYHFTVSAWLHNGDPKTAQLWYNYNNARQQTFTSPINTSPSIMSGSMQVMIKKHHYIDFRMYQASFKATQQQILENVHHTFVTWTLIRKIS